MKRVFKIKKMPVFAGMEFGTTNYKMKKVAVDHFKHEFILHDDGDLQLIGSVRVKRVFIS